MNNINSINKSKKFDVAFVGLTHLGLVSSICTSSLKIKTLALDEDKKIISNLSKKTVEIPEPGLSELLKRNRFFYSSTDFKLLKESPLIFISLDTPTDRPFDLKNLNSLIDKVLLNANSSTTLVIMSQIPVGFMRKFEAKIKKSNVKLYYLLNTLIIGDSVKRFLKPERIVIGLSSITEKIDSNFFRFLKKFNAPILKMSYESAELTKSAINLYLASSIITTNTLSDFCEKVGADFSEILPALKSDKRIGSFAYLKPTIRISGGHLERELTKLKTIASQNNITSGIVDPLIKLNNDRINWLVEKITKSVPQGKVITLWGLSYKKNTDSTDNAASIEIIKKLSKKYKISAYDPQTKMPKDILGYIRFKNKYLALKESKLLIILTDWPEFAEINDSEILKWMHQPQIIDCVGILNNLNSKINVISMGKSAL